MQITLDTNLTEAETFSIGAIVAQWSVLENEIFDQTLLSFDGGDEELPNGMNNAQFSGVLETWNERVAKIAKEPRRKILEQQYDAIKRLNHFRRAIVHSRWNWQPDKPDEITAVRVHKKSIISVKFTTKDLFDLESEIAQIRFLVNFPGGTEEYMQSRSEQSLIVSRKGFSLLTGRQRIDD